MSMNEEDSKKAEQIANLKKLLNVDKIQLDLESMRQNFDTFRTIQADTNAKVDAIFNAIQQAQQQPNPVQAASPAATQQPPGLNQMMSLMDPQSKGEMIKGIAELVRAIKGQSNVPTDNNDFGSTLKEMFIQWLRTQTDAFMIHTYPDAKDYIKSPWWQKKGEHGP